jgi:hypothetical protein
MWSWRTRRAEGFGDGSVVIAHTEPTRDVRAAEGFGDGSVVIAHTEQAESPDDVPAQI